MKPNYSQICSNLLKNLPERQREVVSRRFGLEEGRRETLEFIGKDYGITRERVRQIEEDGFSRLRPEAKKYQKAFQCFKDYLQKKGGFEKEEMLLTELGGENWKNQVCFLLTLEPGFQRFSQTNDLYSLWAINRDSLSTAKKVINSVYEKLKRIGKPTPLKELTSLNPLNREVLISSLEVSKKIQKNSEGLFGLKDWPEINPRGVKDKAYIALKKEKKPLHFREVANLIERALPQTVHNELIKDSRFVLVGRGLYALKEWGYEKGTVKDIISKILKESKEPLSKEEILERASKQRLVKENTILLNLNDKEHFLKTPGGGYTIKEA